MFHRELLKSFITVELVRWTKIEESYGTTLKSLSVFDQSTEAGKKRYEDLHKRVIEHVSRIHSA